MGALPEPPPDDGRDQEAGQRQEDDQRDQQVPGATDGGHAAFDLALDRGREHRPERREAAHCDIASYSSTSGVFLLR